MKKRVFFGLIIASAMLMSFVVINKRYITIGNYTVGEERIPDRRGRAENEVVINRVSTPAPGYNVYIFHTNNGRFSTYRFNRPSTMAFTEAIIDDRNDSTFEIRLQSAANQIDFFILQCNGRNVNLWQETK